MRLGEIKKIVEKAVNESGQIEITNESIFGGQAYKVNGFRDLMDVIDVVSEFGWNDIDDSGIRELKNKYSNPDQVVQLAQEEFNQLNSYISALNQKLPYFYSILDNVVEEQEEQVVNIKLPPDIDSLSKLSQVNKKLETILKIFNIDGQFEFQGFDRGTCWYILIPVGFLSYQCLIHGLDIAKKFFETKEAYYNSEKAKWDYLASLKKTEKFNERDFVAYRERRLELIVEEKVKKAAKKISETNGKTKPELQTSMIMGVKALVKELGEGTEFHLSLNPPEYVEGDVGNLVINYKKIQQIRAKEAKKIAESKPAALSAPTKEAEKENSDTPKEVKE